jgi:DNA-binding response OmpR family regulator
MIWVVTDDVSTAEALTQLIQRKGYAVTVMSCASDLAARAKFRQPKVIIVDCGVMGSFDLVKSLRSDPEATKIALIMFCMTGTHFREQALGTGADAFVPRGSLDWADLLAEIQRFAGPPTE